MQSPLQKKLNIFKKEQVMSEFLDVRDAVVTDVSPAAASGSSVVEQRSLPYDRYIQIPKSCSTVLLNVLNRLSKMAASLQAKCVYVKSDKERVSFLYDNTYYRFEFCAPNMSGREVSPFVININHLQSFFSTVSGVLSIVEVSESSAERVKGFYGLVGSSLIYLETQGSDASLYSFEWGECITQLDASYLGDSLASFTSLLSLAERASEQQLITYGGNSYINLGVVIGKASPFWGTQDCIVNRPMLECVSQLATYCEGEVRALFEPKSLTLQFGDCARLLFAYTTGAIVSRFVSPMFRDLFNCDSYVKLDKTELQRLLGVFSSLDYFKDLVTVEFTSSGLVVVPQVEGVDGLRYTFAFSDGSTGTGKLVLPVSVLAGVLAKATETSRYGCRGSVLLVDTGEFQYAVRSVMSVS